MAVYKSFHNHSFFSVGFIGFTKPLSPFDLFEDVPALTLPFDPKSAVFSDNQIINLASIPAYPARPVSFPFHELDKPE